MKKSTYLSLAVSMAILLSVVTAVAESPNPIAGSGQVLITEIQTGAASAGDEFIELYNPTASTVDITGWQLRYANAATPGEATTLIATIAGDTGVSALLPPHTYFVLRTASIPLANETLNQIYSAKLSSADKVVALFVPNPDACQHVVADAVAWGLSTKGEGAAVRATVNADRLVQRVQNTSTSQYTDTNNNDYDFSTDVATKAPGVSAPQIAYGGTPGMNNEITKYSPNPPANGPGSSLSPVALEDCDLPSEELPPPEEPPIEPPAVAPPSVIEPENTSQPPTSRPIMPSRNAGLKAPHITEILPNPAKPDTDAADESVELYNSNTAPFELSGFVLEAGRKRFVFPQGTLLGPQSVRAFFSADTNLTLSNTQGQVRLLDPLGRVIAQTEVYQKAKDGVAWALAEGSWRWTTKPTPGLANIITVPVSKKKASAKSAGSTEKVAGTVTRPKSQEEGSSQTAAVTPREEPGGGRIHTGVLALVGILALLYGTYEYRHDLANKFHQLRRYRAARREARQSPKRR